MARMPCPALGHRWGRSRLTATELSPDPDVKRRGFDGAGGMAGNGLLGRNRSIVRPAPPSDRTCHRGCPGGPRRAVGRSGHARGQGPDGHRPLATRRPGPGTGWALRHLGQEVSARVMRRPGSPTARVSAARGSHPRRPDHFRGRCMLLISRNPDDRIPVMRAFSRRPGNRSDRPNPGSRSSPGPGRRSP
jgi:hypothetical protein